MIVQTVLESSQDLGMSNGGLPQWKRELLQRRAARAPPLPRAPPPPPVPPDDDEELRYGPGIVKRLKSRYLSLALRDSPRRRPSVLRRATSLEHMLDEHPPDLHPHPPRATRPASAILYHRVEPPRRDYVKRARSVDALSRIETHEERPPPPPPPPPPAPAPTPAHPSPAPRATRPPRRPAPLLRDAERPPADVVRSALRKFEAAPPRRAAPAARVSAVLRGLSARTSPPTPIAPAPPIRCSTPEPRGRSPSPAAADLSAIAESPAAMRTVSRTALESIARAGCTMRYAFERPTYGSHLPTVAATNPVLLCRGRTSPAARRIGVIRPMPAASPSPPTRRSEHHSALEPPFPRVESSLTTEDCESGPTTFPTDGRTERKETPPSAAIEPIPRSPPREAVAEAPSRATEPVVNGYGDPGSYEKTNDEKLTASAIARDGTNSRISSAKIERAWNSGGNGTNDASCGRPWSTGRGVRRGGRLPPAPASTSVVFDFSSRKEVPDYIENDGVVRRAPRRDRLKAGDPGVVVLREGAGTGGSSSEEEDAADGPPSPCGVRFVNDNVLINGRSSMPTRPNRDRTARLKLQFDDSLTRTFEYPSETSLNEDMSPAPPAALADNTRIASAALSNYRPSKTAPAAFQLGVTRAHSPPLAANAASQDHDHECEDAARPCGDDARSWSDARAAHTDLLF